MAYTEGYTIDTRAGRDTILEAFEKVKAEVTRIYGILNELAGKDITATELNALKTGTIDGSRVTGTVAGYIDGSHVTGNIAASKVSGALTNATIASGKVTGLEAFVKSLLPSDDGDDTSGGGITSSSLSSPGYAKFGNGLIIQWGTSTVEKSSASDQGAFISFPTSFSSSCFSVIVSVSNLDNAYSFSDVGTTATIPSASPNLTGFEVSIAPPNRCQVRIFYIAIGE